MSISARISAIGLRAANKIRGELVTYVAGDVVIEELRASRGRTLWTASSPFSGYRAGEHSADWIIDADLLIDADGNRIEPDRGHEIRTEHGETFRVMPFGSDGKLWSWLDPAGQTHRRIHTAERN